MYWASNKFIWIPLYLLLFFLIYREYGVKTLVILFLGIVLIAASDQLTSGLIKNLVERPRPSHEVALTGEVHLVDNYSGGKYGFPSSHSSNSFALAVFIILLIGKRYNWIKYVVLSYAILVAYSRIYLGVHYPGDVICGMIIGIILGFFFYKIWGNIDKRIYPMSFNKSKEQG
jgi:undecaprenyl-diphosphatase